MRRLNSILTASLCVLSVLVVTLPVFQASAQLPGRGGTPTPDNLDEWEVIGIAIRHRETGEVRVLPFAALVVPTATNAPPTPTATPSATPSAMPTATATLTPTPTLPPDMATPTPEVGTPIPTEPPETGKYCLVQIVATNPVNVRVWPEAGRMDNYAYADDGTRMRFQPGYMAQVVTVWQSPDGNEKWGLATEGWFAMEYFGAVYGREITPTPTDAVPCEDLPPSTYERTAWGVWVGQGANTTELVLAGEELKAAGIQPAATVYGYTDIANTLSSNGWTVAYRPFYGDCMDQDIDPVVSARQRWADALRLAAGVEWDWLVLNNECTSLDVWWYKAYLSETVRLMEMTGVRGIVPHVFASGFPELSWFGILQPELARLADAGGAFGINTYPVREGMALCSDDPYNDWTTYRYRMFALPDDLPIMITEFARSWGEAPPDFADIGCFVRRIDGWPVVFAAAWYDAVPLSPWQAASLRGKLDALAAAYRNALQ